VAGGKGDLSWLLCNVDGIDSIVVDPRATDHSSLIKSALFLKDNPELANARSLEGLPTFQPLARLLPDLMRRTECFQIVQRPKNMRIYVDETLLQAVMAVASSPSSSQTQWSDFWNDATVRAEKSYAMINPMYKDPPDCRRIKDATIALDAISSTSLLVGFHPDQATEAIIDLALFLRTPFAVVPCCVFPSQFEHRRLEDGSRVKDYDGFLHYLRNKDKRIRIGTLNFNYTNTARNVVLYMRPDDFMR